MNDRFMDKKGVRHSSPEMQAAQRRFRHHIVTNYRPNARIVRMACTLCTREGAIQSTPSEAHHLNYQEWWKVVWCCVRHHRMIEHESITVRKLDIWDYSSLIWRAPGRGHRNGSAQSTATPF